LPLVLGEHQEQLRDAATESEHVEVRQLLARDLDAQDVVRPAPQVVRGRRAQRQGRDFPQVEPAVEGRVQDLPVADDRLLAVPAERVRLVVGPDAQRVAVDVGLAVAVGDDDIAALEAADRAPDLHHLADGAVAGVDLATAGLRDVRRVGEGGVIDVVLRRDREDLQANVAVPQVG
jgi:hypothetical protein